MWAHTHHTSLSFYFALITYRNENFWHFEQNLHKAISMLLKSLYQTSALCYHCSFPPCLCFWIILLGSSRKWQMTALQENNKQTKQQQESHKNKIPPPSWRCSTYESNRELSVLRTLSEWWLSDRSSRREAKNSTIFISWKQTLLAHLYSLGQTLTKGRVSMPLGRPSAFSSAHLPGWFPSFSTINNFRKYTSKYGRSIWTFSMNLPTPV